MKLPRDVGGEELAKLFKRFGCETVRQTGSHMRLTSSLKGPGHHITISKHRPLRIATLNAILTDVASYPEMEKEDLINDLFQ